MAGIQNGDRVEIHYTGKLEDGRVFDSSEGREPLAFTVGAQEVIEGVDAAVKGMTVGETKRFTLPPELAYGPRRKELYLRVPVADLPEGAEVGTVLGLSDGEHTHQAVLVQIQGNEAILDRNPPLAGQTLVFEIEVVSVNGGGGSILELP